MALLHSKGVNAGKTVLLPDAERALATELSYSLAMFDRGHPLRSRALYCLANLQRSANLTGKPESTIAQLLEETTDGSMICLARQFLDNMARRGRDESAMRP